MRLPRLNHIDLLRYAGLFTYACVGLPLLVESLYPSGAISTLEHAGWVVSYVLFGVSYWYLMPNLGSLRPTPDRWTMLLAMSIAAIAISYFSRSGLAGILLLVMSGVLPWMLSAGAGLAWLLGETVALIPVYSTRIDDYNWVAGVLQSALYFGFSSFTLVTSLVAKGQAEAREEQRRLNAELRATRALLAESTRMNERVRISRELHDLLGHHLTALSLNLEVASHLVKDQALDKVRQAQAVARLLLADVREAVSQLRHDEQVDLSKALGALVENVPEPRIHLELPEEFGAQDPRRAQVLLRCAQEVVTNAIRHARAKNLWLRFERGPDNALLMHARDDGEGADALKQGHGLTGMRERLAQLGGNLSIDTGRGRGFALDARLPQETTT
jgi:signal transduction histidine kinase